MTRTFEDIQLGEEVVLGSHLFTAESIKSFASRFDPQRFHVDEREAEATWFGALCASGWHTVAVAMRLMAEHHRAAGTASSLGPSPGIRELKWLKPVHVGDVITYRSVIEAKTVLDDRPGWGLVEARQEGTDQAGVLVLSFIRTLVVARRGDAG